MSCWGNFLNFSESKMSIFDKIMNMLATLVIRSICYSTRNHSQICHWGSYSHWSYLNAPVPKIGEYLVVFSVVQNLAGIDAVVLIKCKFRYFARYFDMSWTCRTSCSYTIMQQLARFWLTHHIARFFCGSRSSCLLRPTDSLWLPRDAMHPRY